MNSPKSDALKIARGCREEMRRWSLWWRRGAAGSTPDHVLRGAIGLRNVARNMEAQARRVAR